MGLQNVYKTIQYQFEKIESESIILPPVFTRSECVIDYNNPFVNDIIAAFRTHVATRVKGEKVLTFYPPRQSFWDYILRRKPKPYQVKVIAKDVLVNPPQVNHHVIQMYEIETEPSIHITNDVYAKTFHNEN
jgi:hypothetical protein